MLLILQDLKLTPLLLSNLAKELGCKVRTLKEAKNGESKTSLFADLTLPLKFPEKRKPIPKR
jgi:hypothetical protein